MIQKDVVERIVGVENLKETVLEGRNGIIIPLSTMRRVIARKLVESLQTAAQISLGIDVDMRKANAFREKLKADNIKVTINDLIVKAVAIALSKNPILNSTFTVDGVFIPDEINIGVAVGLDNGLLVPVIRNADTLSLIEINRISAELTEKARAGRLKIGEMTGGTFTISNSGVYGIDRCESILNPPEAGILAVAAMKKRPVVIDEKIEIAPILPLNLTYDHRVLDTKPAAAFIQDVKQILENPQDYLLSRIHAG